MMLYTMFSALFHVDVTTDAQLLMHLLTRIGKTYEVDQSVNVVEPNRVSFKGYKLRIELALQKLHIC